MSIDVTMLTLMSVAKVDYDSDISFLKYFDHF